MLSQSWNTVVLQYKKAQCFNFPEGFSKLSFLSKTAQGVSKTALGVPKESQGVPKVVAGIALG